MNRRIKYCLMLILSAATIVVNGLATDSKHSEKYNKAMLFFHRQQYDSAGYYYKSFLQDIDPLDDADSRYLKGCISIQIGNCELMRKKYASALYWFTSVLTEVKGEGPLAITTYQNIGNIHYFQSDFESAIQNYQKAFLGILSMEKKDPVRVFEILANLGSAYIGNHEEQKALTCLLNAESLVQFLRSGDSLAVSGVYLILGKLCLSSNDPVKALNYYFSGAKFLDADRDNHRDVYIATHIGIASSFLAMECFDSAGIYLDKAIQGIRNDPVNLAGKLPEVYLQKGDLYFEKQVFDSALLCYESALHMVHPGIGFSDSTINKALSVMSDPRILIDILGRNARINLGLALRNGNDTSQLRKAYNLYNESIRITTVVQRNIFKDKSLLVFNDDEKNLYSGAIEAAYFLWRSGQSNIKDQLWLISELMRGRVLESKLQESRVAEMEGFADTLLLKRKDVRSKIIELSRKRISCIPFINEQSFRSIHDDLTKLADLQTEDDSLTLRWKYLLSGYLDEGNPEGKFSLVKVREVLDDKECILEYYYADPVLYILLLSADTIHFERVIPCTSFTSRPKDLIRAIQHQDKRDFQEVCSRLYQSLIEPVRSLLEGKQHLIIIPDEEISMVPFEVLGCKSNNGRSRQKDAGLLYLIDEFSISYHFSSSSFLESRMRRNVGPYRFLGIAPGFLGPKTPGLGYDPLGSSLAEIRSIEALFRKGNYGAFSMTNEASVKKNILHLSGNFSHLHFATHSIMDGYGSGLSGLVVEHDGSNGQSISGQESVLWCDEIENIRLKADLVVLSACGSGKGRLTKTEGVLGLPRSFFIAGSPNVLYTLWNIPDHHARNFMEIFYRKFLSGKTYPDALRETKKEMLRSEITSHPYLWAGFVLLGN